MGGPASPRGKALELIGFGGTEAERKREGIAGCRSCRRWRRRGGRWRLTPWEGASRAAPSRTTPRSSWPGPTSPTWPSSALWSARPSSPRVGGARTSGSASTPHPSRSSSSPETVPPISELGSDALFEPMPVDKFVDSLIGKKIGIKALLLDQSFVSGIGN